MKGPYRVTVAKLARLAALGYRPGEVAELRRLRLVSQALRSGPITRAPRPQEGTQS